MLRIDKATNSLVPLEQRSMRDLGYWERRDIQTLICRSPDSFCKELGEYIHIVGTEVEVGAGVVQNRIDLLGVDADGFIVVIELKRDNHKLHLLQALAYAAMVAKWEPKVFVDALRAFNSVWGTSPEAARQTFDDARDELEAILEEGDVEAVNRGQRLVLLAEEFDYEVLATAEWLTQRYDMDIRCYRVTLASNGTQDFLSCARAYPPPELTEMAIRRRRTREVGEVTPSDWEVALAGVDTVVAQFFRREIEGGRGNNIKYKALRFPIGGKRRFVVYAKKRWARVHQTARFDDDVEFWKTRLGERGEVAPKGEGTWLRFYLQDQADIDKFMHAVEAELINTTFELGPEQVAPVEEVSE